MHSRTVDAAPDGPTRFHYNPRLAGDVVMVVPATAVEPIVGDSTKMLVSVPGPNLEAFVLEALRDRMVERLEEMTPEELRTFLFRR